MNARGFGYETAPQPPDGTPEGRREGLASPAMRAAPPENEDPGSADGDQRAEEPAEEPGYGHGV